jgi:hypothetical protein
MGSGPIESLRVPAVLSAEDSTKIALDEHAQRQKFKRWTFYFLVGFSSAFFVTLLFLPWIVLWCYGDWILAQKPTPQSVTLIGLILLALTGVPLSMVLAMTRMAETPRPESEKPKEVLLTTPIYEVAKAIMKAYQDVFKRKP